MKEKFTFFVSSGSEWGMSRSAGLKSVFEEMRLSGSRRSWRTP